MTHVQTLELADVSTLVRVVGRDATAGQVLAMAVQRQGAPFSVLGTPDPEADDPAMVDPALVIARPARLVAEPALGLGYAGFTPEQRFLFLEWVAEPEKPAPPAFLHLYLSMLEVALVEAGAHLLPALKELLRIQAAGAWQDHPWVNRALALAHWLRQEGQFMMILATLRPLPEDLLGLALGWQAVLGTPMRAQQVRRIAEAWELPLADAPMELLEGRLRSLTADLGADPLAAALARLGDEARLHRPWRCAHRTLRIAVPQPDVRPLLQPWLTELLQSVAQASVLATALDAGDAGSLAPMPTQEKPAHDWLLILEFGQTRSDFFELILEYAQRQPGFRQILDEQRKIIYRVHFRRGEMTRFWRLWEYVQSWSSTHVYVNGRELHKSQVWPYSQDLR